MSRQIIKLVVSLREHIGCHAKLIGTGCDSETYREALQKSDEAVALAKYLIQTLENRHHAVLLAKSAGMLGYINMR